ncbi:MAG: beta-lactamase family protein [Gemmatimonadetes bacterium]|nr:beta-lactamase family protein [Gemmatimonadota bacterium]
MRAPLAALLLIVAPHDQPPRIPLLAAAPPDTLTAHALDAYLARAEAFGFSGAVIVARGGRPLLARGYGFADRRRGTPNTTATVFGLSSADKTLIAATALRLVASGRLALDAPIARTFPDAPEQARAITLRQPLSHTSGVADLYWDQHPDLDHAAFARWALAQPLDFAPGTEWGYSNANFWILEEIIARAAGRPFEQVLATELLGPAGMRHTGLPSRDWRGQAIAAYRPWTYALPPGTAADAEPLLGRPRANWMLMTTADDLLQWVRALRDDRVLDAAARRLLWTEVSSGYALGWNVGRTARGTRVAFHGGSGSGVGMQAQLRLWLDEDVSLIILANSTAELISADALVPGIEAILFGGSALLPPAAAPPASNPRDVEGAWTLPAGDSLVVARAGDGRLVARARGTAAALLLVPDAVAPMPAEFADTPAEAILRGALVGDFAALRAAVPEASRLLAAQRRLERLVTRLARVGRVTAVYTALHRAVENDGVPAVQSLLAVRGDGAQVLVRVTRSSAGERTFDLQPLPDLVELPLVPDPAGGWQAWTFRSITRVVVDPRDGRLLLRGRFHDVALARAPVP